MRFVSISVPIELYHRAERLGQLTGRTPAEVFSDGVNGVIPSYPPEHIAEIITLLPGGEVLYLTHSMMPLEQNNRMSALNAAGNEGRLKDAERKELDSLIALYERGTLIKVHAIGEAIQRGLMQRENF